MPTPALPAYFFDNIRLADDDANVGILDDPMPILFEDERLIDMGDTRPHTTAETHLHHMLAAFCADYGGLDVLGNMNLYYHPAEPTAFVSPDLMIAPAPLPWNLRGYRIGETGPAPLLVVEVLSRRSFVEGDLLFKPNLYAALGIAEYLLVDLTGELLRERLLLKQRNPYGHWQDQTPSSDGVRSRLGFRVGIEGHALTVVNEATGERYLAPEQNRRRVRELEAELARLRPKTSP